MNISNFNVLSFFFLVNPPIASSHFQNAQQQNLTQNYSLHTNPMQVNHSFENASFNPNNNNFNNFDQSNQFQYQTNYPQQQQSSSTSSQQYQVGHVQEQQQIYQSQQNMQYYGQSIPQQQQEQHQGLNNGPTSTYQHTINDLLVQNPTTTTNFQQNMFNSQEHIQPIQTNQSVSV